MAHARIFITDAFMTSIRHSGSLAVAVQRLGAAPDTYEPLPNMSTWTLVCEEIVDTDYSPDYYERVVAELLRRNISITDLEEMRVFAWETAGWYNFEKMVWNWCSLDEEDIRKAIEWQVEEDEIDRAEADKRLAYLARYAGGSHQ